MDINMFPFIVWKELFEEMASKKKAKYLYT